MGKHSGPSVLRVMPQPPRLVNLLPALAQSDLLLGIRANQAILRLARGGLGRRLHGCLRLGLHLLQVRLGAQRLVVPHHVPVLVLAQPRLAGGLGLLLLLALGTGPGRGGRRGILHRVCHKGRGRHLHQGLGALAPVLVGDLPVLLEARRHVGPHADKPPRHLLERLPLKGHALGFEGAHRLARHEGQLDREEPPLPQHYRAEPPRCFRAYGAEEHRTREEANPRR
mmetsp:Transcript_21238/g.53269  ORF Transcript_21238/g.53269 Transcript_21238/m.53269 type:complete len:226 (-) Transcript_21238:227-904(-)